MIVEQDMKRALQVYCSRVKMEPNKAAGQASKGQQPASGLSFARHCPPLCCKKLGYEDARGNENKRVRQEWRSRVGRSAIRTRFDGCTCRPWLPVIEKLHVYADASEIPEKQGDSGEELSFIDSFRQSIGRPILSREMEISQ